MRTARSVVDSIATMFPSAISPVLPWSFVASSATPSGKRRLSSGSITALLAGAMTPMRNLQPYMMDPLQLCNQGRSQTDPIRARPLDDHLRGEYVLYGKPG